MHFSVIIGQCSNLKSNHGHTNSYGWIDVFFFHVNLSSCPDQQWRYTASNKGAHGLNVFCFCNVTVESAVMISDTCVLNIINLTSEYYFCMTLIAIMEDIMHLSQMLKVT